MNAHALNTSANNGLRFEGAIGGDEYGLLKLAMPHYDELQAQIGTLVRDHLSSLVYHKRFKVLEIGPGSGITTKVLLDCDPRITITAVDNGEKMKQAFMANIEAWGASSRVTFEAKEILEYLRSVPDKTFDVVATGFVIHNIEYLTRSRLIKEIYRVLVPGGLFVNGDKIVPDDPKRYAAAYRAQVNAFDVFTTPEVNAPEVKTEWVEHYKVDAQPDIVYTEQAAVEDMRNARFGEIRTSYRCRLEAVVSGRKN